MFTCEEVIGGETKTGSGIELPNSKEGYDGVPILSFVDAISFLMLPLVLCTKYQKIYNFSFILNIRNTIIHRFLFTCFNMIFI